MHYLLSGWSSLIGRTLGNALAALGLVPALQASSSPKRGKVALADVLERESDAALGNGGLGRLAACFLDSFAEVGLPAFGYGLRYRYGMFSQRVHDGQQVEVPDDWMRDGNPWEIARPEARYTVSFGGRVQGEGDRRRWLPAEHLVARAYDLVVPAHHSGHVSTLRLWEACAVGTIDFDAFRRGNHLEAGRTLEEADTLNWVLYPDDSTPAGRLLRLKQEAFLVSASLQDLIERHIAERGTIDGLALRNAIHLNDPHRALAPAELMRLLVDEHGMTWEPAWALTRDAISYTNHTLMPEALETWPLQMFGDLLPRHLEIVYEINARFLADVRHRFPEDADMARRVSLIGEDGERHVRMAALAIVASHKVNGVSALHSELMVQTIFADQARLWPDRFHNVTNGVTPRRWLMQANPGLGALIDGAIGDGWRRDLDRLADLRGAAADRRRFRRRPRHGQAQEQGAARRAGSPAQRHRRRHCEPLRRPGQAHPRIQAPAPQPAAGRRALPGDRRRRRAAAAHRLHRRQGGLGLLPGQAHHPARARHRAGDRQRSAPANARLEKPRCSCRTTA